jgi:TolA-binding protein
MRRLILAAALLAPLPAMAAPAPNPTDQINAMSAEATGIVASFRAALLQAQAQIGADQHRIEALEAQVKRLKPKAH